jgi:membrane protein
VALLVGASGVFVQLQETMNAMWEVKAVPGKGVWGFLRKRVVSFGILLALAFLLITSLAVSAALSILMSSVLPHGAGDAATAIFLNNVVAFIIFAATFAALFKFLPDAEIAWRDVWVGAVFTSLLFTIGKFLIGLYLARTKAAAAYGAAGPLLLLLLWTYYSSAILLFGAEFTQVYAKRSGSEIRPARNAVRRTERESSETAFAPS